MSAKKREALRAGGHTVPEYNEYSDYLGEIVATLWDIRDVAQSINLKLKEISDGVTGDKSGGKPVVGKQVPMVGETRTGGSDVAPVSPSDVDHPERTDAGRVLEGDPQP